jgi:predicted GNAT superfamily acetyltransferase
MPHDPERSPSDPLIRAFASDDDVAACVALQTDTWGAEFADRVPASLLLVAMHIGGLAVGAFAPDGTLLGFVFSFIGLQNGETIHWSHMLAVRQAAQGMGVGRKLKQFQRAELARRGIARIVWTFDPLQARNAHLNLNRLGVRVVEYVPNMYGITGSPLHHGLATDRLVVASPTAPARDDVRRRPAGLPDALPILSPFPRSGDLIAGAKQNGDAPLLIEVPSDLQQVVSDSPATAERWRMGTREHFQHAFEHGYDVIGFRRDRVAGRAYYLLAPRGRETLAPGGRETLAAEGHGP